MSLSEQIRLGEYCSKSGISSITFFIFNLLLECIKNETSHMGTYLPNYLFIYFFSDKYDNVQMGYLYFPKRSRIHEDFSQTNIFLINCACHSYINARGNLSINVSYPYQYDINLSVDHIISSKTQEEIFLFDKQPEKLLFFSCFTDLMYVMIEHSNSC